MRNWMSYLWGIFMIALGLQYSLGPANHGFDGVFYIAVALIASMGFAFAFRHLETDKIVAWVWGISFGVDILVWGFVGIRNEWQPWDLFRVMVNFFPIAMMASIMAVGCTTLVTNLIFSAHLFVSDQECWDCKHRFPWRVHQCPNCGRSA